MSGKKKVNIQADERRGGCTGAKRSTLDFTQKGDNALYYLNNYDKRLSSSTGCDEGKYMVYNFEDGLFCCSDIKATPLELVQYIVAQARNLGHHGTGLSKLYQLKPFYDYFIEKTDLSIEMRESYRKAFANILAAYEKIDVDDRKQIQIQKMSQKDEDTKEIELRWDNKNRIMMDEEELELKQVNLNDTMRNQLKVNWHNAYDKYGFRSRRTARKVKRSSSVRRTIRK